MSKKFLDTNAILENNAVEFTMGPSYMEDDIRMETDRMGFWKAHMKMVFDQNNKLGLALVLKTHIDRTNKEIEKRMKMPPKKASFFKKETSNEKVFSGCIIVCVVVFPCNADICTG